MATEQELRVAVDRAESRGAALGLSLQLSGLAGRLPELARRSGLDPQALADAGAVGMLTGDAGRDGGHAAAAHASEFGIDEFIVPGELAEDFAPVISRLTG